MDKNNKLDIKLMSNVIVTTKLAPELFDLNQFKFNSGSEFDLSGYTICNELVQNCQDISYFPNTKSFVLTNDSFCKLVENEMFLDNISKGLNISKGEAVNQIANFFSDKMLLVQQTGVQKYLYKVGTFAQTAGSASMTARTLVMAKAAGVTGLNIIKAQPLLVIALPTVGAMFFHGCGQIIGNNTVGRSFNTIGNILNLPMTFTEITYNAYLAPLVNRTLGIPTILNYTKQAQRGPGLDASEALGLLKSSEKGSIIKSLKCFVIKQLGGKC